MRRIGGVHAQPALLGRDPGPADARSEGRCARNQERYEIRHGSSGDEQAGRLFGKTEQLPDPIQYLALHNDRHVVAAAEIGVEPRGEHLRQHSNNCSAAMHPAHECRMEVAGREGND